jgi:O-antigen/teichoic acid export membrane protein
VFRSLFLNTLVSAAAYFAVSVIGLLIVPMLLATYGLAEFGLLTLARLFLPAAVLSLFDMGYGEIATQVVAEARVNGKWPAVRAQLRLLASIVLAVGCSIGLTLFALASLFCDWLHVDARHREDFATLLRFTALAQPVLFLSLLLEGVVKGFERYRRLRLLEVVCTLSYAVCVPLAAALNWPYHWVAYAFLLSLVLRALLAGLTAWKLLAAEGGLAPAEHSPEARRFVLNRCRLMWTGRIMGGLQHQSPPLLIGALIGPAGVGAYDVLVRLPRFVKMIFSLLNVALLPLAARIDAAGEIGQLRTLGAAGMLLLPIIAFPPLAAAAAFAEPLLAVWLGEAFRKDGLWLALLFLVPAMNTLVGFGQQILMTRTNFVRMSNNLMIVQLVVQFAVSFGLVGLLQERSFVLGYVLAPLAVFIPQMRMIVREQALGGDVAPRTARMILLLLLAVMALWFSGLPNKINSWFELVGASATLCAMAWVALPIIGLHAGERRRIWGMVARGRD